MEKQKTHVAIILDRSGSMWGTKAATVQGYNEQVQQIKEDDQDENHDIFVSLVTFNGFVTEHLWNVPANQLEEAAEEDFIPKGSTAMRDAMGHTIQKLLDTTDSDDPNTAYLVCVISDGHENASKHFNVEALRELTESVQSSNRWTINYMGCDESYLRKVAQETAVPVANCGVWKNDNNRNTDFAFADYKGKLGSYLKCRGSGMTASANFHSEESGLVDNCVPTDQSTNESFGTNYYQTKDNMNFTSVEDEAENHTMKSFGVARAQEPNPASSYVKPTNRTNVFGKGNRVESKIWELYESKRSV